MVEQRFLYKVEVLQRTSNFGGKKVDFRAIELSLCFKCENYLLNNMYLYK